VVARNKNFPGHAPGKVRNEVIMEERLYDLIFITRPATPEDEVKKVLTTIEHACTEKGAKIEKTEYWGTRKLAYKVMKHREGIYVYQQLRTVNPELVHEIERRLGVLDSVIKYQTVRLDEDLKRQKKLTHKRELRAARRPRRATAPASSPAAPPSPAPPPAPEAAPAS
jgi:small subunit ribosomal protein S6